METERSSTEVMLQLGRDCDRCHAELIAIIDRSESESNNDRGAESDYEFHARQLIRSIFAYIEAVAFSMKAKSTGRCMDRGVYVSPQERYFATDIEYDLNERGEVVETTAKISLVKNIRFALRMNRKANRITEPFDASVEWWGCLKRAIRVRDRLTHPKMPGDLDLSLQDVLDALTAKAGFEAEALRYEL